MGELCLKYFKIMITEYNILPNVVLFSSLIKALRFGSKYKKAEKCWKLMTEKYNLTPDAGIYREILIVYEMMEDKEKVMVIFNEYLDQIKDGRLKANVRTFMPYLNVFCKCGEIDKMQEAMGLF